MVNGREYCARTVGALVLVGTALLVACSDGGGSGDDATGGSSTSEAFPECNAYLECVLDGRAPAGDHVIVTGRVVAGELLAPDAVPLTYADTGELDGSRELYPTELG